MKCNSCQWWTMVLAAILLSCSSKTSSDGKYATPPRGEVVFTETSGLDIADETPYVVFDISVYEREDGEDAVMLLATAETASWTLGMTAIEMISPPENGIEIDKTYTVREQNSDINMQNQVSFSLGEKDWFASSAGTFSMKYADGIFEGTFDVTLENTEDSVVSDPETWRITGTIKTDQSGFLCYRLGEEIDTSTAWGESPGDQDASVEPTTPITHKVSVDDPFCQSYL